MCFSEEEEELPLAAVAAIVEQEVITINNFFSISFLLLVLGFVEAYIWIVQVLKQGVTQQI